MTRFVHGGSRPRSFLLLEALDDYVTDTNPVRVVDVFVDELDLRQLGSEGGEPALTSLPSYHPEVTLKIYIYGYLNRIQSSRRLEREARRTELFNPKSSTGLSISNSRRAASTCTISAIRSTRSPS